MSHAVKAPAAADIEIPSNSLWARLPIVGGVLAVVGLGATLLAALGEGRERAMFSYLWAYMLCLSLALGALIWVMLEHVVRAGWSASLRRLGESTMVTLPLFILLWIPIGTLGFHSLYPWTHENDAVLQHKRWFLNEGFFFGRAVVYFAIWAALSWVLYSTSVKQDGVTDPAERGRLTRRMWGVSAGGILLYGLSQSFAAVDWIMSMQPHWYSTMFGVYFFAGSILSFFAFLGLLSMGLQRAGVMRGIVTEEHFHDIGKYVFGYTIFWAYIAFSQFLIIWYGNIPEETIFYSVRMQGGWSAVSYALPVLHFGVPFLFLLSRQVKRRRAALAAAATWVLVMHMMDLYWLVMPNFGIHTEEHAEAHLAMHWTDVTALLGMVGAFLAVLGIFLTRNKVVAVNDPRLVESLAHENY